MPVLSARGPWWCKAQYSHISCIDLKPALQLHSKHLVGKLEPDFCWLFSFPRAEFFLLYKAVSDHVLIVAVLHIDQALLTSVPSSLLVMRNEIFVAEKCNQHSGALSTNMLFLILSIHHISIYCWPLSRLINWSETDHPIATHHELPLVTLFSIFILVFLFHSFFLHHFRFVCFFGYSSPAVERRHSMEYFWRDQHCYQQHK